MNLTAEINTIIKNYKDNKFHVAEHLKSKFEDDLNKIKYFNNEVEPNSVSQFLMLIIKTSSYTENFLVSKTKDKSLHDIQLEYIEIIEKEFGEMYREVTTKGYDFYNFSCAYTSQIFKNNKHEKWINSLFSLFDEITEFWDQNWSQCNTHLQNYNKIKASYGGSLFPSSNENIISTAGLYLDTIVFPCPIMKNIPLWRGENKQELVQVFIKNILDLLAFKNIIEYDLETPIILIFPSEDNMRKISEKGPDLELKTDTFMYKHFNHIFNEQFKNMSEVKDYTKSLKDLPSLIKAIKDPTRIFFDLNDNRPLDIRLKDFINEVPIQNIPPAPAVIIRCLSQIAQGFYINESALKINSTPFITSERSWQQFIWSMEYQSLDSPSQEKLLSTHIPHALFRERKYNLDWLNNIPVETILEIRKNQQEDEIRKILSEGISELYKLQPNNYFRASDQVILNLENAFEQHSKKLQEILSKKLKYYGLTLPLAVSNVTLGIACSVMPSLGVLGQIGGVGLTLAGTTEKIPGIPSAIKEYNKIKDLNEYHKTATGILFKNIKK